MKEIKNTKENKTKEFVANIEQIKIDINKTNNELESSIKN